MKKLLTIIGVAALVLATGCKTNVPIQHALYVTAVSTAVAYEVSENPQAQGYLNVATPIVCAASEGTNIAPAQVVALLQNSPAAEAASSPEGKLALNIALGFYSAIFDEYGSGVADYEVLQNYLRWTCEGLQTGAPAVKSRAFKFPPHVK